jgi:D-sedoheptulose 7-phosphate isomerase
VTPADAIALYLQEQRRIVDEFPADVVGLVAEQLFATYDAGGTVYALANGGNAGTLDHCYCDFTHHPFVSEDKHSVLAGVRRLRFVNLSASPAELSGLVNDLGAAEMYAAALDPGLGPDDLVMAYSGSGNSANVVRALEVAVAASAKTFAMSKGTGGRCRDLADVCLVVPGSSRFPGQTGANDNNFHFEDAMLSVNHMLVGLLKQWVAAS